MTFLLAAAWAAAAPVSTELRTISGTELKKLRDSGARIDLIDVRVPGDYASLRLVGARNVPFYLIGEAGIPKTRTIVLYCSNLQCSLSTESTRALLAKGYKDVRVLEGGYEAAAAAGCSVEGNMKIAERKALSSAELAARLAGPDAPVLLDTRPAAAFAAGHISGARSAPLEAMEKKLPELPPWRDVAVADSSVSRMARAALLLSAGGRTIWQLDGGLILWIRQERPLVTVPGVADPKK